MTKVSELVSQNVGNAIINSQTWGSLIYNVKNPAYGAKGDGSTADTAAIAAAITAATATGGILMFPPGTYITANQTVPSNVTLWFANGAKLSVNTGATVTINGPLEAGEYQIFSGLGLIRGIIKVVEFYPYWWGAITNQAGDNQPGIQAAIDHIQANGVGGKLVFQTANYTIFSALTIKTGSPNAAIILEGNNASLNYYGTGDCIRVNPTILNANAGGGAAIMHWEIRNFILNAQVSNVATYGLNIGTVGYSTDDFQWCLVQNVIFSGFGTSINVLESRHITFRDVVIRSSLTYGLLLQSQGNFCGDMNFFGCEFSSGTDSSVKLFANGSTTAETRGIHFNDCIIYGKSTATRTVYLQSQVSSKIYDIWFNGCQLDQGQNYAFQVSKEGSSVMGSIHINACYAAGFTYFFNGAGTNAINGFFHIKDCMVGLTPQPFTIYELSNIIVEGCSFEGVTTKSGVSGATQVKNIQFRGNTFTGTAYLANQCIQFTTIVKSGIVVNNFGNFATASTFLEDLTTLPATKIVNTGNIQVEL